VHAQLSSRLGTDERIAALLEARSVLHAHGSYMGALELVDRELDLLNRCVKTTGNDAVCSTVIARMCCAKVVAAHLA
jgi:hypothetical protein